MMAETFTDLRSDVVDVVGIGLGPTNLSLAALLDPCKKISKVFFERRRDFRWHEGLLLPDSVLQVSFLKDLVSLVDPTSQYSFLAFLKEKRRMYAFINASFPQVTRCEFEGYLRWVCDRLPHVQFESDVDAVKPDRAGFVVHHRRGEQKARNLVLGIGQKPFVPAFALPHLGHTVIHASEYLFNDIKAAGKKVAVVGGGQTGAEVFLHLLSNGVLPSEVFWISRRWNFHPLDETPFTNELFTPHYSDYFFHLPPRIRQEMFVAQHMASDGISPALLKTIYRKLYELRFLRSDACELHLRPGRELVSLSSTPHGNRLLLQHKQKDAFEGVEVDAVILCTGYERTFPSFLEPIRHLVALDGDQFVVKEDFSIECDLADGHRIYIQNGARDRRGVADPNLSLMSWRSAKIVNSIAGEIIYDVDELSSFVDWGVAAQLPGSDVVMSQDKSVMAAWMQAVDHWGENLPSSFESRFHPGQSPVPAISKPRNLADRTGGLT